jgi:hypothetical protein
MEDKQLNPQESLQLIEDMINKVKNRFSEDGFQYILWGWVVFGCSVLQFVLLEFVKYEKHYFAWSFIWIAVVIQTVYVWKRNKQKVVKTYTDEIIFYIWLSYLIMAFLYSYLIGQIAGVDYYRHITPIMLAAYGMPVFLSGIVLRFKPLIIGGIGCWLLTPLSLYLSFEYRLLMPAVAMLIAWIIPGHLLRSKYKNQKP